MVSASWESGPVTGFDGAFWGAGGLIFEFDHCPWEANACPSGHS